MDHIAFTDIGGFFHPVAIMNKASINVFKVPMKAISYTFAYCGIIFRPLRDIQLKCNEQ
jgi:hypothetical protein